MILVRYSGPTRGVNTLADELSAEGLQVEFDPPAERRGVGQDLVHVAIRVTPDAEAGLDAAAALAAVRRIVRAFNDRLPGIEVEVESLEEAEQAEDEASDDEVDEDE